MRLTNGRAFLWDVNALVISLERTAAEMARIPRPRFTEIRESAFLNPRQHVIVDGVLWVGPSLGRELRVRFGEVVSMEDARAYFEERGR